jgi:hypothetical protein
MKKINLFTFIFLSLCSLTLLSQNTTISQKNKAERETATLHKVMVIPFEPKLYLSEIDKQVNEETKLSAKDIKHKFRDGLNEQLYKALKKANYSALDLMEDTARYKKDIEGIYQYLSYEFQKVPDQENYKAPKKEKSVKNIEKGQLAVETNDQNRFMNAKPTNPKLVPLLYGKYKTDVFIFVNQLDIKVANLADPSEQISTNTKRKIVVHYTVYTLNAIEINSGIAETDFDSSINNPKKIIDVYFSKLAFTIVQRISKGLNSVTK